MRLDIHMLVAQTLAGDELAWQTLWTAIEPHLYRAVRRSQLLGKLSQNPDDCRNVVVDVMGRIRANGYARLAQFAEVRRRNPDVPFMAWLIVVAKRVAIDYKRGHETYIDRRRQKNASRPGGWRDVVTLTESQLPSARGGITSRVAARELFAFAGDELPAHQRTALALWLQGASFEEICDSADAKDGEKLVRAALVRLRRRFRRKD